MTRCVSSFAERQAQCLDFKRRLRSSRLKVIEFAYLAGVPAKTAYKWTSQARDCTPPSPIALRLLSLMEKNPSVIHLGAGGDRRCE